jgi:hypothetical protein
MYVLAVRISTLGYGRWDRLGGVVGHTSSLQLCALEVDDELACALVISGDE